MTMHDDDEAVFAAIRAGARGYQLKGAAPDETLRAIRSVANGEAIFGPGIADRVRRFLAAAAGAATRARRFRSSPTASSRSSSSSAERRDERGDRCKALPQPEDRPQLRLGHLRQAPGRRPRRSRPRSASRRARRATSSRRSSEGVTGCPVPIRGTGQVASSSAVIVVTSCPARITRTAEPSRSGVGGHGSRRG